MQHSIYLANTETVPGISSGSALPLGKMITKTGCRIDSNGTSVSTYGSGTFAAAAVFSFFPSAEDIVTIRAYNNCIPVPGALARVKASAMVTVPLLFFFTNESSAMSSNIIFVYYAEKPGTLITMENAAVQISKL